MQAAAVWAIFLCCVAQVSAIEKASAPSGGDYTNQGSFVVAFMDSTSGEIFCSGSLLSSMHVLTAASCWVDLSKTIAKRVHGNALCGLGSDSINKMAIHRISSIKSHPSYTYNNLRYHPSEVVDLAVVLLEDHVDFLDQSNKARAVVMITGQNAHIIDQVSIEKKILSFGRTEASQKLQQIQKLSADKIISAVDDCVWSPEVYHEWGLARISYFDKRYHICMKVSARKGLLSEDVGCPLIASKIDVPKGEVDKNQVQKRPILLGTYQGMAPGGKRGEPLVDLSLARADYPEYFISDGININTRLKPTNYYSFTNLLYWAPWVQATAGVILPSTYWPMAFPKPSKLTNIKELQWDPANKLPNVADAVCASSCKQSSSKSCWCDVDCEVNGDCCPDYPTSKCKTDNDRKKETNAKTNVNTEGEAGCAMEGACGWKSGKCWCDDDCTKNDDCCDNYAKFCLKQNTCLGKCGQKANGCWCDPGCVKTQDCCPDYMVCAQEADQEKGGSCLNKCGMKSGDCWCDDGCIKNNDCCPNFLQRCGMGGSCEGRCGLKSGNCWCDATCLRNGDCCENFQVQCSHTKLTDAIIFKINSVASGRR